MKTRIFTLYYFIECCTMQKTKPLAWVSTVNHSGHFDYSHAYIYYHYQSNVDYFVVESPTMVIFS
jgi:hypothetical protein